MTGTQRKPGRRLDGLVPSPAHLEKDLVLALEQDLPVIDAPRKIHVPKRADQIVSFEAMGERTEARFRGRARQHENTLTIVATAEWFAGLVRLPAGVVAIAGLNGQSLLLGGDLNLAIPGS